MLNSVDCTNLGMGQSGIWIQLHVSEPKLGLEQIWVQDLGIRAKYISFLVPCQT